MRDTHSAPRTFDSLLEVEAEVLTEDWPFGDNLNRPHRTHGWFTPVEFVEAWLHQEQLALACRIDGEPASGPKKPIYAGPTR